MILPGKNMILIYSLSICLKICRIIIGYTLSNEEFQMSKYRLLLFSNILRGSQCFSKAHTTHHVSYLLQRDYGYKYIQTFFTSKVN